MELSITQALEKGQQAFTDGQFVEADKLYTAILNAVPDHPDANNSMGMLAVRLGKIDQAIPYFENAVKYKSDNAKFWQNYIFALLKSNKIDEARENFELAQEKFDKTLFQDFVPYFVKKNDALADENKSVDPETKVLNELSSLFSEQKFDELILEISKIISKFPYSAILYNFQGVANYKIGNLGSAVNSFDNALKINPRSFEAYVNLGNVYKNKKDYNNAIKNYLQAIKLNPNLAEAFYNLGLCYRKIGDFDQAIENYNSALELKGNSFEILNNLGTAYMDKGEITLAIESLQKAIEIDPYNLLAQKNLSYAKGKAVPFWHVPMMNETSRNELYQAAINLAVKDMDKVLDIGTGSGLLSLMAADKGAYVVTCEESAIIYKAAKKVIEANGYSEKIKIINKNSSKLDVGEDLDGKADILVSEILSSELVGENVQAIVLDAKQRLLKPNARMIPEKGFVKIALVENTPYLSNELFVGANQGYDLSEFNAVTQNKFVYSFIEKPKFLSESMELFSIDFTSQNQIKQERKTFDLEATRKGVCAGVIQWIKIGLYQEIEYENNPLELFQTKEASGWRVLVYRFQSPLSVKKGQNVKIQAELFDNDLWISQALET